MSPAVSPRHPNYSAPIDYRKAVFIMTSNEGSEDINRATAKVLGDPARGGQAGHTARAARAALEYADFDDMLKQRFAKREAWLAYKNRVDYYIPFLPIQPAQVPPSHPAQAPLPSVPPPVPPLHCANTCNPLIPGWMPTVPLTIYHLPVKIRKVSRVPRMALPPPPSPPARTGP